MSIVTYRGWVKNGVVLVEGDVELPEGIEVRIELENGAEAVSPSRDREPTIGQKLAALGRWAETLPCDLPEDLAENHDHYIHGTPKRS